MQRQSVKDRDAPLNEALSIVDDVGRSAARECSRFRCGSLRASAVVAESSLPHRLSISTTSLPAVQHFCAAGRVQRIASMTLNCGAVRRWLKTPLSLFTAPALACGEHRGDLIGSGMTIGTIKMPGCDDFGQHKDVLPDAYRPERLPTSGDYLSVLETKPNRTTAHHQLI